MWGCQCRFCGNKATDAAHVIPRTKLGKHRYADPRLGRPLCRRCHGLQEAGTLEWSGATLRVSIDAANKYLKVKI